MANRANMRGSAPERKSPPGSAHGAQVTWHVVRPRARPRAAERERGARPYVYFGGSTRGVGSAPERKSPTYPRQGGAARRPERKSPQLPRGAPRGPWPPGTNYTLPRGPPWGITSSGAQSTPQGRKHGTRRALETSEHGRPSARRQGGGTEGPRDRCVPCWRRPPKKGPHVREVAGCLEEAPD